MKLHEFTGQYRERFDLTVQQMERIFNKDDEAYQLMLDWDMPFPFTLEQLDAFRDRCDSAGANGADIVHIIRSESVLVEKNGKIILQLRQND